MSDKLVERAMFGAHALHGPCQIVLQSQGKTPDGRTLTAFVGVIVTEEPALSAEARAIPTEHELLIGDMIIRPLGKFSGREAIGHGLSGIATSSLLSDPGDWSYTTLDNGYSAVYPDREIPPRFVK